jgi:hypothetical protein
VVLEILIRVLGWFIFVWTVGACAVGGLMAAYDSWRWRRRPGESASVSVVICSGSFDQGRKIERRRDDESAAPHLWRQAPASLGLCAAAYPRRPIGSGRGARRLSRIDPGSLSSRAPPTGF